MMKQQFNPSQQAASILRGEAASILRGEAYVTDYNETQLKNIKEACKGQKGFGIVINKIQRELRAIQVQQTVKKTAETVKKNAETVQKLSETVQKLSETAKANEVSLGKLKITVEQFAESAKIFQKDVRENKIKINHVVQHLSPLSLPPWLCIIPLFIQKKVTRLLSRSASYLQLSQSQEHSQTGQSYTCNGSVYPQLSGGSTLKHQNYTIKSPSNRCPKKNQQANLIIAKKEENLSKAANKDQSLRNDNKEKKDPSQNKNPNQKKNRSQYKKNQVETSKVNPKISQKARLSLTEI